jgi:hypothetical protein
MKPISPNLRGLGTDIVIDALLNPVPILRGATPVKTITDIVTVGNFLGRNPALVAGAEKPRVRTAPPHQSGPTQS